MENIVITVVFFEEDIATNTSSCIQMLENNLTTYEKIIEVKDKENKDPTSFGQVFQRLEQARLMIATLQKFIDGTITLEKTITEARQTCFCIPNPFKRRTQTVKPKLQTRLRIWLSF